MFFKLSQLFKQEVQKNSAFVKLSNITGRPVQIYTAFMRDNITNSSVENSQKLNKQEKEIIIGLKNQKNILMPTETIQITPNTLSKTNWVKQIYFYSVIALALLFFCIGVFTFGKAALIKFVFPKADSGFMYMPYSGDPEQQCKNGQGSQYWYPKQPILSPDPTKPYTPPVPTDAEIKECIEATSKGIAEQKERTFQSDTLTGLLMTIISAIVGGIHYAARAFFLRKE